MFLRLLFVFLIPLGPAHSAWAKENAWTCEPELRFNDTKPRVITPAQAAEIIGPGTLGKNGPLLGRAIKFLQAMQAPFDTKIQTMEVLFQAIRKEQNYTWDFEKFDAPDGAVGFSGGLGHFVLLQPNGRMFKGMLDPNTIRDGKWIGRCERIDELVSQ